MSKVCATAGKVKHSSEEDAKDFLQDVLKKNPDYDGQPYFCLYCELCTSAEIRDVKNKKEKEVILGQNNWLVCSEQ